MAYKMIGGKVGGTAYDGFSGLRQKGLITPLHQEIAKEKIKENPEEEARQKREFMEGQYKKEFMKKFPESASHGSSGEESDVYKSWKETKGYN